MVTHVHSEKLAEPARAPWCGARLVRMLLPALLLVGGIATGASSVGAQALTFRRELPPVRWEGCAVNAALYSDTTAAPRVQTVVVSDSAAIHAEKLAADATEAAVLGNSTVALQLLTRAATLDPSSASIAYRRARALEAIGDRDSAILEYCRYILLPGADDREAVTEHLAQLAQTDSTAVPSSAVRAFVAGLASADQGRLRDAELSFGTAIGVAPEWSTPWYNRAIARIATGNRDGAAADLERYLALGSGDSDSARIRAVITTLREPIRSPTTTLVAGIVVPGLGQFTTGRPVAGLVVLGSAVTAIAAGVLIERTEIACLAIPVNGNCPRDQVLREDVERPYMTAAIGVAAAIGIGGAIEAWRRIRTQNERSSELLRIGGADGALLEMPAVHAGATGADVALIRVRF